jgi:CSLREA domain-containing protein
MRFARSWRRPVLAVIAGILLYAFSPLAQAATFVVTKTADTNDGTCDSDCSLREAIIAANANAGADVITLPAGTYTLTIRGAGEDAGATGDLDITDSVTINGAGASTTIVNGNALDRVFHIVSSTATVTINGITITGGLANISDGGGILNEGTLTVNNCVITGNSVPGGDGGGIYNDFFLTISGSTVSGNTASNGDGGGIYDNGNASTIANCTISGNSTPNGDGGGLYVNGNLSTVSQSTFSGNTSSNGDGAGIYNNGNDLEMTNCTITGNTAVDGGGIFHGGLTLNITTATIAGNTASNLGGGIETIGSTPQLTGTIVANNTGGNCDGTVTDGGTNLQFPGTTCSLSITSADPLLGPLANNGGPTQTMAIGPGSPAIDANTEICPPTPATDQRGVTRPQGAACDIGAFEFQGIAPTPTPSLTPSPGPSATATPAGVPTPTATPGVGPAAVVPTLSWPALGFLGLLLATAALFLLRLR